MGFFYIIKHAPSTYVLGRPWLLTKPTAVNCNRSSRSKRQAPQAILDPSCCGKIQD